MSAQDPSVMAHAAPSAEDPALASGKIRSMLKKILKNGIAGAVRFLLSIRVGSGTGLAAMDGQDGAIIANGPVAKLVMGNQGNPNLNQWAHWRYVSPIVILDSQLASGQAQFNTQLLASVMRNSLRVGTGTGLATLDGQDGMVLANGPGAAFVMGDTGHSALFQYATWSFTDPNVVLTSWRAAGHVQINTQLLATVMKNSLRVGTGGGLAGSDGQDGRVMANGPSAGFMLGDQGAPNNNQWAILTYVDPIINVSSWRAGNQVQINTQLLATVMKNSLRVGSGTGISGNDGNDGEVITSGANAGFLYGDRGTPTSVQFGALFQNGGTHALWDSVNGSWLQYLRSNSSAVLKRSLRVGNGTAVAAQDGQDGVISADGAASALWVSDRSVATFGGWYFSAGVFYLYINGVGNVWSINPAGNGIITQDALAAITPNTGLTIGLGGFLPSGTRVIKPTGETYVGFSFQTTAPISAGGVIATMAVAGRPTGFATWVARANTATGIITGYIHPNGQFFTDQALPTGLVFAAYFTFYP